MYMHASHTLSWSTSVDVWRVPWRLLLACHLAAGLLHDQEALQSVPYCESEITYSRDETGQPTVQDRSCVSATRLAGFSCRTAPLALTAAGKLTVKGDRLRWLHFAAG